MSRGRKPFPCLIHIYIVRKINRIMKKIERLSNSYWSKWRDIYSEKIVSKSFHVDSARTSYIVTVR